MTESDWLAEGFEQNRTRLRSGGLPDARLADRGRRRRSGGLAAPEPVDASGVDNLGAWLTTIVGPGVPERAASRQRPARGAHGRARARPGHRPRDGTNPEDEALLADSVGLALQVVLDTLAPAERLAFVLHDMFACPSTRSPPWWGAPRPRRGSSPAGPGAGCGDDGPAPTPTSAASGEVVDAFFAAARDGEFEALVAVLDPDVVLRSDGGTAHPDFSLVVHGAARRGRAGAHVRAPAR